LHFWTLRASRAGNSHIYGGNPSLGHPCLSYPHNRQGEAQEVKELARAISQDLNSGLSDSSHGILSPTPTTP
jgi:hypothetical protein